MTVAVIAMRGGNGTLATSDGGEFLLLYATGSRFLALSGLVLQPEIML
jgi:hypothetical protein